MKTTIEIANLTKKRIDPDFVKKIVRKTALLHRYAKHGGQAKLSGVSLDCLEISVVFVNEAESRKINRKYRQKNKSTDVLSFNLDSGYNKDGIIQGEIILCPDIIRKSARENKIDFSRELGFVLAHGVLHILGWRHGKKMYELQDKIVKYG
jgi:probable rRNA maturation factor